MRALVFAGLATTSTYVIKQWKGINVGENIFLKKKKRKKREENTWETILIQKISYITVKIKNKKKNKLFKDFNLSTFVIVRNLTIWLVINMLETDI